MFCPAQLSDLVVGAVGQLQFDVVAYRLKDEYKVEAIYEPVNVYHGSAGCTVTMTASSKSFAKSCRASVEWTVVPT